MDQPSTYEQFRDCLRSLERSNRITFNYRPTLAWLEQLPQTSRPLHILDVGCGGGDMLRRVDTWARRRQRSVQLTGIDLNPYAARAAREATPASMNIQWVTANAYTYHPDTPVDVVISSLFAHHLEHEEILTFLRWMHRTARVGWLISDLERQPVPYHFYWLLSRAIRLHPFVQHDGPLSIRRSFRVQDWQKLCTAAGLDLNSIQIRKQWPARLCVSSIR